MGLFDWIFGKKLSFEVRVLGNDAAKLNDLVEQVGEDTEEGRASLVLYHFPDIEAQLRNRFPDATVLPQMSRDSLSALQGVNLLAVADISDSFTTVRHEDRREDLPLKIHLAERFPICGPDEIVLQLTAYATPKRQCINYVSLDEPWMAEFIGGIKDLLKRLDWEEEKCLSGGMIAKSIDNAQKKLSKEFPRPWVSANSAEDWLMANSMKQR